MSDFTDSLLSDYEEKFRELFCIHESLMVELCKILKLDYLEVTEEAVINAIKEKVSQC